MTDWTDKDARKVRAKVNARAAATLRTPQRLTPLTVENYARALGVTVEEAAAKIEAHQAHLAAFHWSENPAPARPVIDARGPTDFRFTTQGLGFYSLEPVSRRATRRADGPAPVYYDDTRFALEAAVGLLQEGYSVTLDGRDLCLAEAL